MAKAIRNLFFAVLCGCGSPAVGSESPESDSDATTEAMSTESTETTGEECPELIQVADVTVSSAGAAAALPKYTEIQGWLRIEDVPGLTDLRFLQCLEVVHGLLIVNNPDLETLEGLERLTTIPGESQSAVTTPMLGVNGNEALVSLDGLSALVETPRLEVHDNPKLVSLEGLSSLRTVSTSLSVLRNESLETIGLRVLENTQYIQIGYARCVQAGPAAGSEGNGLLEFDGLDSLLDFGYMRISEPELQSLEGLIDHLEGSLGAISFELNGSLPYAEILAAADALAGSVHISSCGGLDDPIPCECAGPD